MWISPFRQFVQHQKACCTFCRANRRPFDYLSYFCRIHRAPAWFLLLCSLFSLLIYFDARFIRLPQCAYNTNMPVSIGTRHIYPLRFCLIFMLSRSSVWPDRFFPIHIVTVLFRAFVNENQQFINIKFFVVLCFCSTTLALFRCAEWVAVFFFLFLLLCCFLLLIAYTLFICDMWEASAKNT